jgi:DNA polymerase I
MRKLVLVDGNAIVHRAYHALPPLSRKDGKLTNAVYGFFAMILKITSDLNPDSLIVCFDRAAPTFRKQMYAGYQATRPQMEDDLSYQFGLIHEVLEKIKVCIFELDGYEADDLIGTLAKQAIDNNEFDQVVILTGDRDLLQLVNKDVLILAPIVGVTKMILFDEEKVREKYGLEPSRLVDYKALVGDASDNYPGVTGVGPKTASSLINNFGSLEGIYENLGEVNPKVAEKLATDAEQAVLAKKLATIETNAPIKLNSDECSLSKLDRKALLAAFEDLTFNSLISRFKLDKKSTGDKTQVKEKSEDQMNLF